MRQVTHALLTRPPLSHFFIPKKSKCFVRLACVRHAASVHPEPGSNSHVYILTEWQLAVIFPFFTVFGWVFRLSSFLKFSLKNFRDCFIVQLSMFFVVVCHTRLLLFYYIVRCLSTTFSTFFNVERRRRDLNPRAATNDLLPFQGSPFSLLGISPTDLFP